jgi:hypothetical protein
MSEQEGNTVRSHTDPKSAWLGLSKKAKAVLIAIVAILGGWSTIKATVVDPAWAAFTQRQPAYDQNIIANLKAGVTLSRFQADLHTNSVAVLRPSVDFSNSRRSFVARDELYILKTVYVEVFIDNTQTVVGYTITSRTPETTFTAKTGGWTFRLGSQKVSQVSQLSMGTVAGVCGAHISAYYEVSTTSNADNNQTVAVGYTSAGALPSEVNRPPCIDTAVEGLAEAPRKETDTGLYVIIEHIADDRFMAANSQPRSKTPINTVAITAPDVNMAPEMISLHPDFLTSLDPNQNSEK